MGRYLGRGREWVSRLENGKGEFSDYVMLKIEELERVQLQHKDVTPDDLARLREGGSVAIPIGEPVRYVPVVSWAHAGEAVAYEQIPLHDQDRVVTMSTDPRAFAITVEGESMLPDFKPGDRVIVAPSREPRSGKPCITKLADDGVILRLFHRLGGGAIRLSSLRPEIYPGMDLKPGEYRWCWPVEELNRKV